MGKPFVTDQIDDGAVTDAKVAAANKDGTVGTPSMRTLGTGAQQAAVGTHVTDVANPHSTTLANTGSGTLAELNTAISDATLGLPRQESITTEVITNTDTDLADTIDRLPVSNESVLLFLNTAFREQGPGKDYIITGQTIKWLALSGTAPDLDTGDTILLFYMSAIVIPPFSNTLSLDFDGVNDKVIVPDNPDLDGQAKMSVSAWFKAAGSITFGDRIINKNLAGAGNRSYEIVQSSSNNLRVNIFQAASDNVTFDTPTNSLTADTWHHLVWVFDGAGADNNGKVQIYIDGVLQTLTFGGFPGNTLTITSLLSNAIDLGIGANSTETIAQFLGNIDEVAYFNIALNQAGVDALRSAGAPVDLIGQTGLTHFWRMGDGDTFPTILDQVGSLNGAMTNMTAGDIEADVAP